MRAAGIFAPHRGERNDAAHVAERAQIEPIMPGQIEPEVGIGDAGGKEFRSTLSIAAIPRSIPARSRNTPTSSHMASRSFHASD